MAAFKTEIWKEIRLRSGKQRTRYGVSNHGRVCSFRESMDDKKLLKGTNVNGYPALKIKVNETDHQFYVHKLVAEYFVKKGSGVKPFVIHLDHNKINNKASNLTWVSKPLMEKHQQQSPRVKSYRDKIRAKGHKLSAKSVSQIKAMIFSKNRRKLMRDIADQFGISE